MMNKKSVIIFVKFPEKGKVKTRLAKTTSDKFAVNFYRKCAEHTFGECEKLEKNVNTILFISDENDKKNIRDWTNNKFKISIQKGNSLGEKIYNAFEKVFKIENEKIIIIGTDLPDISNKIIDGAFNYLNDFDSVIGPTSDGGYYLLGLKKLNKEIFANINWSTKSVFDETINRIKKNNVSFKILPQLSDIDTEDDLKAWLRKHPENNSSHNFYYDI